MIFLCFAVLLTVSLVQVHPTRIFKCGRASRCTCTLELNLDRPNDDNPGFLLMDCSQQQWLTDIPHIEVPGIPTLHRILDLRGTPFCASHAGDIFRVARRGVVVCTRRGLRNALNDDEQRLPTTLASTEHPTSDETTNGHLDNDIYHPTSAHLEHPPRHGNIEDTANYPDQTTGPGNIETTVTDLETTETDLETTATDLATTVTDFETTENDMETTATDLEYATRPGDMATTTTDTELPTTNEIEEITGPGDTVTNEDDHRTSPPTTRLDQPSGHQKTATPDADSEQTFDNPDSEDATIILTVEIVVPCLSAAGILGAVIAFVSIYF